MADLYSAEMTGTEDGTLPQQLKDARLVDGKRRRVRATITLASQATTDNILLGYIPQDAVFDGGRIVSSVSLGSAVIAIGTNKVHASNGQFRAAATFTAVDTPTGYGLTAAFAGAAATAKVPVYLTIATAALPASGTLLVEFDYVSRA